MDMSVLLFAGGFSWGIVACTIISLIQNTDKENEDE